MLEALDRKEEKLSAAERRLAELLAVLIEDLEEQCPTAEKMVPVTGYRSERDSCLDIAISFTWPNE